MNKTVNNLSGIGGSMGLDSQRHGFGQSQGSIESKVEETTDCVFEEIIFLNLLPTGLRKRNLDHTSRGTESNRVDFTVRKGIDSHKDFKKIISSDFLDENEANLINQFNTIVKKLTDGM